MGAKEITMAKAMLKEGSLTVPEIAEQLGVSTATLYRHLPGGRSAI